MPVMETKIYYNNCKICNKLMVSKVKNKKICDAKTCYNKWKLLRNSSLIYKKTCPICEKSFEASDKRNNYCSPKCKYRAAAKTMLVKYGYENPGQKERSLEERMAINEKISKTTRDRYLGGHHVIEGFLKKSGYENIDLFYEDVIAFIEKNNIAPYSKAVTDKFKCSFTIIKRVIETCGRADLLYNHNKTSSLELSLQEFLRNELELSGFLTNYRPDFMSGKELDIYFETERFGIEMHGLAMHSERPLAYSKNLKKVKYQHALKYELCKQANTRLVQIFEDEWISKTPIIKSMIKNRLGLISNKVFARKTILREVSKIDALRFFEDNHVSGYAQASKILGLYYSGELVGAIALRKPWNKSYGNCIEIARFASKIDLQVVGGFQKLLKETIKWAKDNNFNSILTYADCRFGSGKVYKNSGFMHLGKTAPNYFYEKNGVRESRFKHRKRPFLKGLTEREQQNNLGWHAIYDAGSEIYLYNL